MDFNFNCDGNEKNKSKTIDVMNFKFLSNNLKGLQISKNR